MPEGQQSFIPKASQIKIPYRRGIGWFTAFNGFLFTIVLLVSGALFFYRGLLLSQVEELNGILERVEGEFEPALIIELRRTVRIIDSAKQLFKEHAAPSAVFDFLEENTLPETRFSSFSYKAGSITMSGVTGSYTTLAQQSLVFEGHPMVKRATFSNFSLGNEGFVNFSVELLFEPAFVLYQVE